MISSAFMRFTSKSYHTYVECYSHAGELLGESADRGIMIMSYLDTLGDIRASITITHM